MIDTHCHITSDDYNIDEVMVDNLYIINNGTDKKTNEEVVNLVKEYKNMFGAIGIHPEFVKSYTTEDIKYIEDHINDEKIVAIGEIGLDYHYGKEDKELQKQLFIKQIELANKYKKTIIIHSRDAIEDTYNILKEHLKTKAVMHCFSSSKEEAIKLKKLGILFGIGGVVTFKNAKVLKEVVSYLDLNDLLLETDSPYLTPEPFRGEKNYPKNIEIVASKIAEIKNISKEEVIDITTKNACLQFDLHI